MPAQRGFYTLPEILRELAKNYCLPDDSEETLRKKAMSVCREIPLYTDGRKTDLWEKTRHRKEGSGKDRHLFTPYEKQLLEHSHGLMKYLVERSGEPERIRKEFLDLLEAEEEAEKANRQYSEYRGNLDPWELQREPDNARCSPGPSMEEVKQKKMEFMLEALFLKFFTPVDVDGIARDMETCLAAVDGEYTAETIQAAKRLSNGTNYYTERTDGTDASDKESGD